MAIPKLTAYALPTAAELPTSKVNWAFEPERAALLIHDMQEYFLNFWGENNDMMQQVVANIAKLRAYCKEHNIPVYYTAQPKDQSDEDRALLNDMWGPGLTRSPEQQRIVAELILQAPACFRRKLRDHIGRSSPAAQLFSGQFALERLSDAFIKGDLITRGAHNDLGIPTRHLSPDIEGAAAYQRV